MDTCASTATNAAPATAHPAAYAARLAVPFRAGATVVARVCTGILLPDSRSDSRSNDVYLGGVGVVRVRDELGDHRAGLVVQLDAQLVDRKPGDLQLVAGDLRDHGEN